jgi:hypothetical protein
MTQAAKRLIAGSLLTASAATYYTSPTNTKTTISAMTLTNTTGTARTVTIYLVASGGSASASNAVLMTKNIGAYESYNVKEAIGQTLEAGGFIQALADSSSAVSIVASGYTS